MTTPSPQPAKPALTPEEVIDWLENEAPAYELLFSPTARYSASKFSAMASTIRGLKEESDLAMQIVSENVKLRGHLSHLLAVAGPVDEHTGFQSIKVTPEYLKRIAAMLPEPDAIGKEGV